MYYIKTMTNKFLIVEDDPTQRHMISLLAKRKLDIETVEAANGNEALSLLREDNEGEIRLVILDLHMPQMDGIEVLGIIVQQYPKLPVIMLTGTQDIDKAVKTMKLGAYDFLRKPIDTAHFEVSVRNALKMSLLEKEVTRLKRKDKGIFSFQDLIGHETGLAQVVSVGRKAAASDIPILLTGETGVGKDVFARAVHGESSRVGSPFIAINCGAIPENLVESILFGHEKGAFTGAISKSIGCFREADGGTILLDEIGDLPLNAQVKLLRVLQEKEVHPVGADKPKAVNVRIISATNHDLEQAVINGTFREDLYFRLNVLPIHIPSLRERRQDIPALIRYFMERLCVFENQILKDIPAKTMDVISSWEWQGNVRELENIVHRAMIMSEGNSLNIEDFSFPLATNFKATEKIIDDSNIPIFGVNGKMKTMDEIEQSAMQLALKHHNGNITQAAISLNIAKSTFYRKLKEQASVT